MPVDPYAAAGAIVRYVKYRVRQRRALEGIADLDCLACSMGGVGTSVLIQFLKRNVRINDDQDLDHLKHLASPPRRLPPNVKAIYMFGDPLNACLSLFRRRYQAVQAAKLGEAWIPSRLTLDTLAESQTDRIGLIRHFERWADPSRRDYSVLLLRYETLWSHLDCVADHLGLQRELFLAFPPFVPRQSDAESVAPALRDKLLDIYGPMREKIDRLPDAFLSDRKRAPF